MSKELTEKWKNGELETGHYYIEWSYDCDPRPSYMIDFFDKQYNDGEFMLQRHKYIDEVLAPVPSYEEYNELLDLNVYDKLQKENKKLKEQIEEANKLILWCARLSWTGDQREDIFDKYLAKWGVK